MRSTLYPTVKSCSGTSIHSSAATSTTTRSALITATPPPEGSCFARQLSMLAGNGKRERGEVKALTGTGSGRAPDGQQVLLSRVSAWPDDVKLHDAGRYRHELSGRSTGCGVANRRP